MNPQLCRNSDSHFNGEISLVYSKKLTAPSRVLAMVVAPAEFFWAPRGRDVPLVYERGVLENALHSFGDQLGSEIRVERAGETVGVPIRDIYRVEEDIRFLSFHPKKNEGERLAYIRENVRCFLNEFAGKTPFARIEGILRDDELEIGGFGMLASARRTVRYRREHNLPTDREEAELSGLRAVHQALLNGARVVVWDSPSREADYRIRFLFIYRGYDLEKGGRVIDEYIINKPEPYGSIEESKRVHNQTAQRLNLQKPPEYQTAEEILRHPLIDFEGQLSVEELLEESGVSRGDIKYSEKFEAEVQRLLMPLIYKYALYVGNHWDINVDSGGEKIQEFIVRGQKMVEGIYYLATLIRKRILGEINNQEVEQLRYFEKAILNPYKSPNVAEEICRKFMSLPSLMIMGGAQCLSWRAGFAIEESSFQGLGVFEALGLISVVGSQESEGWVDACMRCPYCGNTKDNKMRSKGNKKEYLCGNLRCLTRTPSKN